MEGSIVTYIHKGDGTRIHPSIQISQNEREPLEDYCAGARQDGTPCYVQEFKGISKGKPYHFYEARIFGVVNVHNELKRTRRYLRTEKKKGQIKRFYNTVKERPLALTRLRKYGH